MCSSSSRRVTRVLDRVIQQRGTPKDIHNWSISDVVHPGFAGHGGMMA
jgi:hypothetical protein